MNITVLFFYKKQNRGSRGRWIDIMNVGIQEKGNINVK